MLVDIGADVNVGAERVGERREGRREGSRERGEEQAGIWEDQTPICVAVISRLKPMVELLLDLGVSNVNAALKLSRELELDEITGILLKNIALDRNGDTVNLSGMELCLVKPQWILPCLGVSEALRHNHLRRQSFDRIKDLLMRRKSIGCIEDKTLERLRADMEGVNRESGALLADGVRVGEETDSGIPKNHSRGHRRARSGNIIFTPPKKDCFHNIVQESSFSSLHVEGSNKKKSQSPSPIASRSKHDSASPSPPIINTPPGDQSLQVTSDTPKRPPRQGSSSVYQPTLPPIHGTPVSTLQRLKNPPKWSVAGIESSEEMIELSTSPPRPNSCSMVDGERRGGISRGEDSQGTLVTSFDARTAKVQHPRTPQRRHHSKLNSLMIKRGVPPSTHGTHSFIDSGVSLKRKKPTSVSPAVLLRRVSMWGKKRRQRKRSSSTCSTPISRPESPPPRIYIDVTTRSRSEDSRDSTPVPAESVSRSSSHSRRSSDEGIWTEPSTTATTHVPPNSLILSPTSDSTDGEGGMFSPNTITSQLHTRRKPSSSYSKSGAVTDTSATSRKNNLKFRNHLLSEKRERVTSARLVRVLDLSSNLLNGLELMVGVGTTQEDGGEIVLKRLKGLHRLDLKQNRLCRLPRVLMRELKKLTILNLSCNAFGQMPSECVLSPALTSLDLSSNRVCVGRWT